MSFFKNQFEARTLSSREPESSSRRDKLPESDLQTESCGSSSNRLSIIFDVCVLQIVCYSVVD